MSTDGDQEVGDGITADRGAWKFSTVAPEVFDTHISKSIPGYDQCHDIIVKIAKSYLAKSHRCYDLGCSTGALTSKLASCADAKNTTIIGIDQIPDMLDRARLRCAQLPNASFELADITHYDFLPAHVIVSFYTLQFIPIMTRKSVTQRIFDAILPGGILILFEKIRDPDPVRNEKLTAAYHAFKRSQGFTDSEICQKAAALEGVLVPQTELENFAMLREAGFSKIKIIFQELCWQGYLAQK